MPSLLHAAVATTQAAHPLDGTAARWLWLVPLLPLLGFAINGLLSIVAALQSRADGSVGRARRGRIACRPRRRARRRGQARAPRDSASSLRRNHEHRRPRRPRARVHRRRRDLHGDARGRRRRDGAPVRPAVLLVDAGRRPSDRRRVPARPIVDADGADRHRRRRADPRVQRRLHARRPGLSALFRVSEPLRLLHAVAGTRRELPADVHRLGGRRALLVFADRLLVQREGERRRRQESVHRQPHRRFRVPDRDVPALREHRHVGFPRRRRRGEGVGRRRSGGDGDLPVPFPRLRRQERADPALHLAPRRDGRPDAGLGAHPRGDDGDRRRVSHRAKLDAVLASRRWPSWSSS